MSCKYSYTPTLCAQTSSNMWKQFGHLHILGEKQQNARYALSSKTSPQSKKEKKKQKKGTIILDAQLLFSFISAAAHL